MTQMTITSRRMVRFDSGFYQIVRNLQAFKKNISFSVVRCIVTALGVKNSFWRNPKLIYSGAIIRRSLFENVNKSNFF